MGKYGPYSPQKKIHCKDTGEDVIGSVYLQSKHWKQMRETVYEYYNHECQRCGDTIPLEVANIHHRTYKRLGNEKVTDLILYCEKCHACIHKSKRKGHAQNKTIQEMLCRLSKSEKAEAIALLMAHFPILADMIDDDNLPDKTTSKEKPSHPHA